MSKLAPLCACTGQDPPRKWLLLTTCKSSFGFKRPNLAQWYV